MHSSEREVYAGNSMADSTNVWGGCLHTPSLAPRYLLLTNLYRLYFVVPYTACPPGQAGKGYVQAAPN
jgi:hypothetical protein